MIISDNPAQKWVINESILASLTGCFEAGDQKIRSKPTAPLSNQANNTHGLGARPQPRQSKD